MVLNGIRVKFFHNNPKQQIVTSGKIILKKGVPVASETYKRPYTECTLILMDEHGHDIEKKGKALLAKGDNFCKEKGRVISLGRAMKEAGFTKSYRATLWEAYRTSSSKPRW